MPEMEMYQAMKTFTPANRRYLGCKSRLITFIHKIVEENCPDITSVADIFAGTGVVADSFADTHKVIVNDILESNLCAYHTFFSDEPYDAAKVEALIASYNEAAPLEDNYYSLNFADTYLSAANMRKVGYIRRDIDARFASGGLTYREKCALITSLLYAIDRIANTVGHYDAYRRGGDLTAELILATPEVKTRGFRNEIYKEDANVLAESLDADLVYIDPPYNSRQYSDAYHFLENVALGTEPPVTGVARKMDRSALKSHYCTARAESAFEDLINKLKTRYILVSYNNTGHKTDSRSNARVSDEAILRILGRKGEVRVFETDFTAFSAGKSKIDDHTERLFLCIVDEVPVSKADDGARAASSAVLPDAMRDGAPLIADTPSPLNYTGGKFKILPQLRKVFPEDIPVFYDVFCGGANVAANIDAGRIVALDNDACLISLLNYLKRTPYETLLEAIEREIARFGLSDTFRNGYEFYGCDSGHGVGSFNKEPYMKLRDDYNNDPERPDLKFLILIIYAFNNQIRFNADGRFNLPVGKRDFNASLRKKLRQFVTNIRERNVRFECLDFRALDVDELGREGAFLYLDPPYFLGDAAYNENGRWTEKEEEDLLDFLEKCHLAGARFALSNVIEHKGQVHEKLIRWCLGNGFNIHFLSRSYNNANYHLKDKETISKEVLITNYL